MSRASLPEGEEKTARVRAMFDAIAPRYDLVNRLITFGLDQHWRHRTVRALGLPPGATVLDLACGTGALAEICTQAGYRVVGADGSAGMLSGRVGDLAAAQADVAALPFSTGSFDGVVCGYALRNFTDLASSLAETARVLRPGGRLAVLEVATPPNALVRAGHRLWFHHAVPRIGGTLSDRGAYRYLPDSVAYLPDERALREILRRAGFSAVGRHLLQGGLSQIVAATRAGAPAPAGADPRGTA